MHILPFRIVSFYFFLYNNIFIASFFTYDFSFSFSTLFFCISFYPLYVYSIISIFDAIVRILLLLLKCHLSRILYIFLYLLRIKEVTPRYRRRIRWYLNESIKYKITNNFSFFFLQFLYSFLLILCRGSHLVLCFLGKCYKLFRFFFWCLV